MVSFLRLQRTPPGFEAKGAAAAFVGVPDTRYATSAQQAEFFAQVIEQLRAQPGVTDAAAAIGLPLSGFNPRSPYSVEGAADPAAAAAAAREPRDRQRGLLPADANHARVGPRLHRGRSRRRAGRLHRQRVAGKAAVPGRDRRSARCCCAAATPSSAPRSSA